MDIYFERLVRRSDILGNHYKKYIGIVERNIEQLYYRLERARLYDRVHLWQSANDIREEMELIVGLGKNQEEKLADLGCYFSLQFLQMNLSALDALMLEVTKDIDRYLTYKNFMIRLGHTFRRLTGTYMEHLLRIFMPPNHNIEFVILGVGTRADQDDIDVGVVDTGPEHRDVLNRAVGRMNSEMLKKAVSLHFHLSEHVASSPSYSASLDEYNRLLTNEIHDFVIISEMLGAARIVGSRRLFFQFKRQVTSRYYYRGPDYEDSKYHEGYLRGIVGETRSFMFKELSSEFIRPKTDGLRMIKGGLLAAKTIYNLRQVNAWAMLHALEQRDKRRKIFYIELERTLSFLEIFRYLYQLLNTEEDEIYLSDKQVYNNLAPLANAMGYRTIGVSPAQEFLIVDYYKHVMAAKKAVKELLPSVTSHMESVSIFGKMLHHRRVTGKGEKRIGNLALRFLNEVQFFRGTRFWDDVVKVLEAKDAKLLRRLANDLCSVPQEIRDETLRRFIDWGWNSFITMFSVIILLNKYREKIADRNLFLELNELYFQRVKGTEEEAQRISIVFTHHPKLVYEYIILLTEKQQRTFYSWLNSKVWDPEVLPARDALRLLLKVQFNTSNYFQRTMNNVLSRHPEYLKYLNNPQHLRLIGDGTLGEIEMAKTSAEKLDKLLFYHDFQFFHMGIRTLLNYSTPMLGVQFNEFSDNYIRYLFDTVKHMVDRERNYQIENLDALGLFVTGGHGQMQAFDDDYDLIILLNSDDNATIEYTLQIIRRMHREIVKCGILPHYHLADQTGSYICTFSQIKSILHNKSEETFIHLAQLVNARMLVGSSHFLEQFEKEILTPHIYKRKKTFIKELLKEIYSRRVDQRKLESDEIDLKDDPGGLRDIETFLIIIRTMYQIREHSNFTLLTRLQNLFPDHEADLRRLYIRYQFLRRIRNLSRLTVAADNILYIHHLVNLTEHLDIRSKRNIDPAELLLKRVWEYMRSSEKLTNRLLKKLVLPNLYKKNLGGFG